MDVHGFCCGVTMLRLGQLEVHALELLEDSDMSLLALVDALEPTVYAPIPALVNALEELLRLAFVELIHHPDPETSPYRITDAGRAALWRCYGGPL